MADTKTFRASAVGLMAPGAKPAKPHQGDIARAASLPDGGIKDGDYGEGDGEQNVNHAATLTSPFLPFLCRSPPQEPARVRDESCKIGHWTFPLQGGLTGADAAMQAR
jgi:hypothetical protein